MSPCVPVCPSQCAAVFMACATMGHLEMEAACVLLDTPDPAVTKVGRDAGIGWNGSLLLTEQVLSPCSVTRAREASR